jgi:hypothetical protein
MSEPVDPENLQAAIEWLCSCLDRQRVAEMELTIDLDPMPALRDGEVVLFGFEGQVDAVWTVHGPPPTILLRPIFPKLRTFDSGPTDLTFRSARYDRVGENTYVRVE